MNYLCFVLCISVIITNHAREHEIVHLEEGNLALLTSQQPGPLFCFGQNILDQGDVQAFVLSNSLKGKHKRFTHVVPNLLCGVTDTASLFAVIPVATQLRLDKHCSSGIEDIFIQGEYAFYNQDKLTHANQATLVANITLPTGSSTKIHRLVLILQAFS